MEPDALPFVRLQVNEGSVCSAGVKLAAFLSSWGFFKKNKNLVDFNSFISVSFCFDGRQDQTDVDAELKVSVYPLLR